MTALALPATYSPPQVARRQQRKPESVIADIKSGRLGAFNIASPGSKRPRYRITAEALEAFERSLAVVPPPKPAPRRPARKRRYFQ